VVGFGLRKQKDNISVQEDEEARRQAPNAGMPDVCRFGPISSGPCGGSWSGCHQVVSEGFSSRQFGKDQYRNYPSQVRQKGWLDTLGKATSKPAS
jgi:hypothetical protein